MAINTKIAAMGAAGIVAIGGAGLYAGTLGVSPAGQVGAGEAAITASCTSTATVTPGLAAYNPITGLVEYNTATVTWPSIGSTPYTDPCNNQYLTVTVYRSSGSTPFTVKAATTTVQLTANADAASQSKLVTFTTGVDASLAVADYKYAVVIQATNV